MDIAKLLALIAYRAFDVDAECRILADSDATGSVQSRSSRPWRRPGTPQRSNREDALPKAIAFLARHLAA